MRIQTRNFVLSVLLTVPLGFLASCSHQSVLPETESLKVVRENPKDCKDLGKVTGATSSTKGTAEEALEDMKKTAAEKGATHLVVHQYSSSRSSVTGQAFQCP